MRTTFFLWFEFSEKVVLSFVSIYRSGVCEGLYKFAKREREEEVRRVQFKELSMLEKARAEEEEEDKRRLARLAGPPEKETEKV